MAHNCTMNFQYLVITYRLCFMSNLTYVYLCDGDIVCTIVWCWSCYTKWSSVQYTSITSVSSITKFAEAIIQTHGNVHTTRKEKEEFSHCFLLKCQNKIAKYSFIRLWILICIFNTQNPFLDPSLSRKESILVVTLPYLHSKDIKQHVGIQILGRWHCCICILKVFVVVLPLQLHGTTATASIKNIEFLWTFQEGLVICNVNMLKSMSI